MHFRNNAASRKQEEKTSKILSFQEILKGITTKECNSHFMQLDDRDVDVDFFIVQKLFASAVHQILLNQHILIRKYGLKYICNIILWTPKGNQPVQQNLLQLLLRYCFCQTTARSWSTKLSFKSFSQLGIMEQLRWEGSVGGQSVNLLLKAESALRTGLVSQGFI